MVTSGARFSLKGVIFMYAIVETGSKQYKVQKGDVFEVEKLDSKPGKSLKLDKVLLFSKAKSVEIGKTLFEGR